MPSAPLPRCLFRGCPIRFRVGDDRACADHTGDQADTLATRMERFTELAAPPGEHHPGAPSARG